MAVEGQRQWAHLALEAEKGGEVVAVEVAVGK